MSSCEVKCNYMHLPPLLPFIAATLKPWHAILIILILPKMETDILKDEYAILMISSIS